MEKNNILSSHILIVDDDDNMRKTLCDDLSLNGYSSMVAVAYGRDALAEAKRHLPDLAIIDLRLPDTSGLDVLRDLKKLSPDTECIMVTGYVSMETAIEAVTLDVYSYMQKPYDVRQLLLAMRRALERHATMDELAAVKSELRAALETVKALTGQWGPAGVTGITGQEPHR